MFRSATIRILIGAALVTAIRPSTAADNQGAIVWKTDLKEGYDLAKSTRKPMVVYFYATNQDGSLAQFCNTLEHGALSNREVNFLSNSAVFVRVNTAVDDSQGNVKKLVGNLKITQVPFVVVLECRADELVDWGQVIGEIPSNDFAAAMREYIIRAVISIGAYERPSLNDEEVVQQIAKCQEEFNSLRDKFMSAHQTYLAHHAKLLEHGEMNVDEFLSDSRTLSAIQLQMQRCLFEFATIPSGDVQEYGRHLMNINYLMYSEVLLLEEDLVGLTTNGRLSGPFAVTMAQLKVREATAIVESESARINESLAKAKENFQKRFEGFVSN